MYKSFDFNMQMRTSSTEINETANNFEKDEISAVGQSRTSELFFDASSHLYECVRPKVHLYNPKL